MNRAGRSDSARAQPCVLPLLHLFSIVCCTIKAISTASTAKLVLKLWLIYTEYYLLHFHFFAYSLAFCCAWATSVENVSERGNMVCWSVWVWDAVCR